ncbi:hypothetical protein [Novosphingobium sp.]|uniref:hypothetical protein n=1 Tax=Novosphingobium sp. TaxID=1874826 RepID=UPI00261827A6|nr:hypothetical protein [Novosphingobium sp.]
MFGALCGPGSLTKRAGRRRVPARPGAKLDQVASQRGARLVAIIMEMPSERPADQSRECFVTGTNPRRADCADTATQTDKDNNMGKGILLWLLGIPLPIIILLVLFWH